MIIGGFLKQSLIDFPGKIASVIFTSGCNFRCFYCHNPELVLPELIQENLDIDNNEVLEYLDKNKYLLDAVVITGGEPTLHSDLPNYIKQIKLLGLSVKLDTNGTNPKMLNELIENSLVDFVAMDIKSPLKIEKYQEIVGEQFTFAQLERIFESIQLIKQSDIKFEFRSTLVKPYHSMADIKEMSGSLFGDYFLQEFNQTKILNPNCENLHSFNSQELNELQINNLNEKVDIKIRSN